MKDKELRAYFGVEPRGDFRILGNYGDGEINNIYKDMRSLHRELKNRLISLEKCLGIDYTVIKEVNEHKKIKIIK